MSEEEALACTKRGYDTKKEAQTIRNLRTKGRSEQRRHRPKFLRAYHCDICNLWHLTHQYKPPRQS